MSEMEHLNMSTRRQLNKVHAQQGRRCDGKRGSFACIGSSADHLFLRVAHGAAERTERPPVWLMRQAGRYDPEYQRLRADAGLELEDLFRHPEHAARITMLPMRLGVDAAILFQDILTPLTPLGASFIFRPGPVLGEPVRSPADVERLQLYDVRERLDFVGRSIEVALDLLDGEAPLIGFAGAPWTLAAFLIEGASPSRGGGHAIRFTREHPDAAHAMLALLAEMTIDYLRMQIEMGVHAMQLFESCADLLSPDEYNTWALPYQRRVLSALAGTVPRILFARDVTDLEAMRASGADVLSVCAAVDLRAASDALAVPLQGNVCNRLLRDGPPEAIERAVRECIAAGIGHGHILNLGHGILPGTPFEHVVRFIETARRETQ
jgi:uroporphyrinogen decarboxylase